MRETNVPEIDVDELMEKIRAEVRQRKEDGNVRSSPISFSRFKGPSGFDGRSHGTPSAVNTEKFEIKDHYHIKDFLKYHDQQFVMNAYRGILRRGSDSGGLQYYSESLRTGKMTKAEILGRLRYSPEGRAARVKIAGLFWNFAIQSTFRIPVLGYLSRLLFGIGNLPAIIRNMQVLEGNAFSQLQQQRDDFKAALSQLGLDLERKAERRDLEAGLERKADRQDLEAGLERKADRQGLEADLERKADRQDLEAGLEKKADRQDLEDINNRIRDILRQTRDHKLNIIDQQRRLMFLLEEARKRLPEPISTDQIKAMLTEEDHILDAMYVSFEDRFRGTREDIKERQRVYLPYLEAAGAGREDSSILDVGCGRGEWLELLKYEGFKAKGVDANALMVEKCKIDKLNVVKGDAIDFLRNLNSNCMSAISGFHIVEHLPIRKMISLFDESLRVLKPGGIVIFETPNPENVLVGSCTFYSDPTHKNPIPPDTLMFLLEYRGFVSSELLLLHPLDFVEYDKPDSLRDLVYRFNMAQDYAVIARKA